MLIFFINCRYPSKFLLVANISHQYHENEACELEIVPDFSENFPKNQKINNTCHRTNSDACIILN